jgi:hypothetical protein
MKSSYSVRRCQWQVIGPNGEPGTDTLEGFIFDNGQDDSLFVGFFPERGWDAVELTATLETNLVKIIERDEVNAAEDEVDCPLVVVAEVIRLVHARKMFQEFAGQILDDLTAAKNST